MRVAFDTSVLVAAAKSRLGASFALVTLDYLRAEAAAGRREDFDDFLAAVPEREVGGTDQLE